VSVVKVTHYMTHVDWLTNNLTHLTCNFIIPDINMTEALMIVWKLTRIVHIPDISSYMGGARAFGAR